MQGIQVILCSIGVIYAYKLFMYNKIYLHRNVKIYHLWTYIFYADCRILVPDSTCRLIQIPLGFANIGFIVFNFSIITQYTYSTFYYGHYVKEQPYMGVVLSSLIMVPHYNALAPIVLLQTFKRTKRGEEKMTALQVDTTNTL
uniref:Serpentine receptor class gamma n=1 Tax=Heterorhabditis bacteriophora TaxID=37862 RepID=A0A1I7X3W5_HETBA